MGEVTTPFKVTGWEEDRTSQDTPRVTPAHVTFALPELGGAVKAEYLMTYVPGGDAHFIFTDVVEVDRLQGKQGSFITQGTGIFHSKTHSVSGAFEVVSGTGTGGFEGVHGNGSFKTCPESEYKFSLSV